MSEDEPAVVLRYVPILKAKQGEYAALVQLAPAVKAVIVPLLEVPPIPWDYEADAPAKTIDAHVAPVIEKIRANWGSDQVAYLDLGLLPDEQLASGQPAVEVLFGQAAAAGLLLIPIVGLDSSPNEVVAIAATVARDGRGMGLRLVSDDLLSGHAQPPLVDRVNKVLHDTASAPRDVDLLLDFGPIPTGQAAILTIAWSAVIPTLPYLHEWRTFTIAGSAFPASLAGLRPGITAIPREEWLIYQSLVAGGLPRNPDFGDYAVAHPELADVDPRLMRMSASIRYTTETEWLVVKGGSVRRLGFDQTRDLCRTLLVRPEAQPARHCAGCTYVHQRTTGAVTPGNATTWRRIGTAHHLTTVVGQLTTSTGP